MKPSICAYTSLFSVAYLQNQLNNKTDIFSSQAVEYCNELEKSVNEKVGFINNLLSLDTSEEENFNSKCQGLVDSM